MKDSPYKYTCIAVSLHGLLQYLLLQSEEAARSETFYFFSRGIPKEVREKLPSVCPIPADALKRKEKALHIAQKLWLRVSKGFRWPFVRHTKIYAQDHGSLSMVIGKSKYSLLSDAPEFLKLNARKDSQTYKLLERRRSSLMGRLEAFVFTPISLHAYGDNSQCEEIFLTAEDDSHVLEGKEVHLDSFETLWERSSESKRLFILDVFGITPADLEVFRERPVVFFSQPMVDRHTLTVEEYVELLKRIFAPYDRSSLLIKVHPLEDFRYEDYFPDIAVCRKKIGSQMLQLVGVHIEKAITICSTSVYDFSKETEVVWLGTSIHPKIEKFFGKAYEMKRPDSQTVKQV